MSLGGNIRHYREVASFSQKDLADRLSVTPQAVSRWENDTVEPSVDTLILMSHIFSVTMDDLTGCPAPSLTLPATPAPAPAAPAASAPAPETSALKEIGTCACCGKKIFNGGHVHYATHLGPNGAVTKETFFTPAPYEGSALLCEDCYEKKHEASLQPVVSNPNHSAEGIGWGIFAGVLAIVISIAIGVVELKTNQTAGILVFCFLPLIGYGFFSLVYVLMAGNTFVSELFMATMELAFVKMPGIIFSFDLDGFVFLVVMKVLFFLIQVGIALMVAAFSIALSMLFSIFAFPYSYTHKPL